MIIFLIGFMGSGKSYYAKSLSAYLNVPYYDLDTEIERLEGKSINQIFADHGEPFFRKRESAILKKTVEFIEGNPLNNINNKNNIFAVIACGGGTPCFEGNMDWMNQQGFTLWIAPPVPILTGRLEKEKEHRPLIRDFSKSQLDTFVHQKLAERSFFYSKANLFIQDPVIDAEGIIKQIKNASNIF